MFELLKGSARYVCVCVGVCDGRSEQDLICKKSILQVLERHSSPHCHCRRTRRRMKRRSRWNPSPVERERQYSSALDLLVKQAPIVLNPFLFDGRVQMSSSTQRKTSAKLLQTVTTFFFFFFFSVFFFFFSLSQIPSSSLPEDTELSIDHSLWRQMKRRF